MSEAATENCATTVSQRGWVIIGSEIQSYEDGRATPFSPAGTRLVRDYSPAGTRLVRDYSPADAYGSYNWRLPLSHVMRFCVNQEMFARGRP